MRMSKSILILLLLLVRIWDSEQENKNSVGVRLIKLMFGVIKKNKIQNDLNHGSNEKEQVKMIWACWAMGALRRGKVYIEIIAWKNENDCRGQKQEIIKKYKDLASHHFES